MSDSFTEADYENSVIELFKNMGYEYVYGPDVERDYKSPLYDEVLNESLHRLNPSLPDSAITDALYKLKNFENGTLIQKNTVFMNYLQNGIEVSYHEKGETRSDIVYIADYDKPANNSFIHSLRDRSKAPRSEPCYNTGSGIHRKYKSGWSSSVCNHLLPNRPRPASVPHRSARIRPLWPAP